MSHFGDFTKTEMRALMKQAQAAELSPTETVDFFAVNVFEMDIGEWADSREVSQDNIRLHVNNANGKIEEWAAENTTEPDGDLE